MNWTFIDDTLIKHKDGHAIRLTDGSWNSPFSFNPSFANNLPAVEAARVMREGFEFAANSTRPKQLRRSPDKSASFERGFNRDYKSPRAEHTAAPPTDNDGYRYYNQYLAKEEKPTKTPTIITKRAGTKTVKKNTTKKPLLSLKKTPEVIA